jgi:apolipoprotein N-acyltransferase
LNLFRISIFRFRIFPDWFCSTFGQALFGALLLWAALPPLDFWPLAWIAPVPWIMLIRREKLPPAADRPARFGPWKLLTAAILYFAAGLVITAWFHDRQYHGFWIADTVFWAGLAALVLAAARLWAARPYRSLFLAGLFFWLAALHWLRLPYWAIGFGWLAAGIYFGCYFPVFVAVSRVGVHRLRLPLILVAPAVYTGMELAQAHLLSGMTMGCLEHTQYRWTTLIQISDVTGCYGVTFLITFVAACLARMLPCDGRRWTWWPIAPAAAFMGAVLAYGEFRTTGVVTEAGLKMALIQGKIDIQLDGPDNIREITDTQYRKLTHEALNDPKFRDVDLILWPETVFCLVNWVLGDADAKVPADFPGQPEEFQARLENAGRETRDVMTAAAREFGLPMLVGVQREHYGVEGRETFNSAALVTPDGQWCDPDRVEQSYYDKMHLVPFGEFMPFAKSLPWLQTISPLGAGTTPGERPKGFLFKKICLVPNICYETVLPYVIRDQLVELRAQGIEPQILVNVTNDGWFWGSSELEQHLACGVYRTVECRRPMVIAANTGISASIDGNGRIVEQGPVHGTAVILADVRLDRRESWYLRHGDWFAGSCLIVAMVLACVGATTNPTRKRGS